MTNARSFAGWVALSTLVAAAAGGCNALTGAGDFTIDNDMAGGGDEGGSGSGDPTTSGNGPTSGGETTGGGGAPSTGSSMTGGPPSELGAAPGVTVTEIAMYQVLKHDLMPASSKVPLIAGRGGLLRVFTSTDGSYDGAPVTARLYIGSAAPLEVTQAAGGSSEQNLGSTLNIEVPGELMTSGATYHLDLGRAGGTGSPSTYPAAGADQIPVQSSGSTLKVKLIPVSYGADGSNRLPDTSAGQVKLYQDRFYSMYPIPSVEISVHAAVQWNSTVAASGNGWDSLLNGIANLREQDNAPNDVYYYGVFAPASSFGNYCGGGCVAGLGMIGGPSDAYSRAAIGLGFSGPDAGDTAVHEIGHTHGREHAPCQVSPSDPNFPHPGGVIGEWGYDSVQHQLIGPDTADMMGYCFPIWISDYTYSAVFNRIKTVNNALIFYPPELKNRTYEQIAVGPSGTLTWLPSIKLREPPQGETHTITIETAAGTQTVEGNYFPYDHLEGGVLFVRQPAELVTITSVALQLAGKQLQISR